MPHEPKTHNSTYLLSSLVLISTTAMASSSSHIPASDEDKSQDENDIYWPEVITDQIKKEIVSYNQRMSNYYEKQSDLYSKQYWFEHLIYDERAWIDNAKEEIQKKEKWIADTKRKIEKKEKKIWDAGCDKFKVTEKLEDLDERIEAVSDFLDEARKRYPKYFKDEGF